MRLEPLCPYGWTRGCVCLSRAWERREKRELDHEKTCKPCFKINLYHEGSTKTLKGFKHRSDMIKCAFK